MQELIQLQKFPPVPWKNPILCVILTAGNSQCCLGSFPCTDWNWSFLFPSSLSPLGKSRSLLSLHPPFSFLGDLSWPKSPSWNLGWFRISTLPSDPDLASDPEQQESGLGAPGYFLAPLPEAVIGWDPEEPKQNSRGSLGSAGTEEIQTLKRRKNLKPSPPPGSPTLHFPGQGLDLASNESPNTPNPGVLQFHRAFSLGIWKRLVRERSFAIIPSVQMEKLSSAGALPRLSQQWQGGNEVAKALPRKSEFK